MNVHELEADLSRIGLLEFGLEVLKFDSLSIAEKLGGSLTSKVLVGESETFQLQPRVAYSSIFERIDVCLGMAKSPVVID